MGHGVTSELATYIHLYYNIPPAVLLTTCYYPLCTKIDVYKVIFLILIAVASTTPWDSYLIRRRIWTYPPNAIVGPTLFQIPAEEIFFFIIQTYNTSLLYLFASKPTFHPIYLCGEKLLHDARRVRLWRWLVALLLAVTLVAGAGLILSGGQGLYMGLIIVWAGPFILMLWEAFFFLVTNILIVFGLVAFDNALAILSTFPTLFPTVPSLPSPIQLVKALMVAPSQYDDERIIGSQQALERLRKKSRSFYLASGCFQGRLRIDLVLLYSFCRVADDLVDNASSVSEAKHWILKLTEHLDICYAKNLEKSRPRDSFVRGTFPASAQSALLLLPTTYLSPTPLYDLVKGFETDLEFASAYPFPIIDEQTLQVYGSRVAGTVAELCLELAFRHAEEPTTEQQRQEIVQAGGRMGVALQYVNIARDIAVDAKIGRVYLPTSWLKSEQLTPEDVLENPLSPRVETLRQRLLDSAMKIYEDARGAIELLPTNSRGPMRVAVESYVEIGRVLREPGYKLKAGRATVPKLRRLRVAWAALRKG
ncbi:MAG: hypothetical protein Q9181_005364 [Wetmoreana brouardii]